MKHLILNSSPHIPHILTPFLTPLSQEIIKSDGGNQIASLRDDAPSVLLESSLDMASCGSIEYLHADDEPKLCERVLDIDGSLQKRRNYIRTFEFEDGKMKNITSRSKRCQRHI